MRETALYGRLRPKLNAWGAVDRVENALGSGMWDIAACVDGRHCWVETKMDHGKGLHFERFQLVWLRRQLRAGSTSCYLIYGLSSRKSMVVVEGAELVRAPVRVSGKWTVVDPADLKPALVMTPPYDWDTLRRLLATSPVPRDDDTGYTGLADTEEAT